MSGEPVPVSDPDDDLADDLADVPDPTPELMALIKGLLGRLPDTPREATP